MAGWTVYIIEAEDGALYTGVTTDLERRFAEHLAGRRGARWFRGRRPRAVRWFEDGHDRASAARREHEIKRLSRAGKLALIAAEA